MKPLAISALLVIGSPAVSAQDSGWGQLGRALAHKEQPAVALLETSLSGQRASAEFSDCLESKAKEFASRGEDVAAAVSAAKGECWQKRQIFYSAVYNDMRAETGRNGAIRAANSVLAQYDADVDAGLPAVAIRAKQQDRPADPQTDKYSQLIQLKGLLDSGALTQAEFDAEKRKILDSR